jgi:hypothetical protein
MFRPLCWAIIRSQDILGGETTVWVIKYILWPEDGPAQGPKRVVSLYSVIHCVLSPLYVSCDLRMAQHKGRNMSSVYTVWYTVQFLLFIYPVTWGWPSARAETCRQSIQCDTLYTSSSLYILWPEDGPAQGPKHVVSLIIKVTTYRQLCFDLLNILLSFAYINTKGTMQLKTD